MNVTVVGATGRTGSPLVLELLRRGHTVTALVRDPAKLGPLVDRIRVSSATAPTPPPWSRR
jgi:putative NADH-flavin reductase